MARILCVEDNDDNLFMLQRRLTRAGCDAYQTKPADFELLVGTIRSLLSQAPKP